jgi:hypothetical protein
MRVPNERLTIPKLLRRHLPKWSAQRTLQSNTRKTFIILQATRDVIGIMQTLAQVDITARIFTTTGSAMGSVDTVKEWQRRIPRSKLLAFDADSVTSPRLSLTNAPMQCSRLYNRMDPKEWDRQLARCGRRAAANGPFR